MSSTTPEIETIKFETLKLIYAQIRDYEKDNMDLSKSYIGHILAISALFLGFVPQFIQDLGLNKTLLWIFSLGEILLFIVIALMLIIYSVSMSHQEHTVNSTKKLYQLIANADGKTPISEGSRYIEEKANEKNIKTKFIVNLLSKGANILFFLGISLVFAVILTSLYN